MSKKNQKNQGLEINRKQFLGGCLGAASALSLGPLWKASEGVSALLAEAPEWPPMRICSLDDLQKREIKRFRLVDETWGEFFIAHRRGDSRFR